MSLQLFTLALFDGISYAALLFLVAAGLTLIFGVMGILNVAHGSLYAIGAYVTVSATELIVANGYSPLLAFPVMLVAAVGVGVVLGGPMELLLVRRVYGKPEVLQLLVTFAVFMILEDLQRILWGVRPYFESSALQVLGNVSVFGIAYTTYQLLFLPIAAVAVLLGLRLFLRRSLAGKMIVAVAENREAAQGIGIDAGRVFLFTFIVGAVLSAFGGALASATTSVVPAMGADMVVLSFVVVATAGLGQIEGAALAALLVGLARSFSTYLYPELQVLTPYLIMLIVLLVRPCGLFGTTAARRI